MHHRMAFVLLSIASCVAGWDRTRVEGAEQSWLRDADRGLQMAQSRQQPMVLFISMHGCSYCQKMIQTTFHDPQVLAELGHHFIPTAIDSSERPDLVRRLKIRSFPTTLVVAPDGKVLDRLTGYHDPRAFQQRMAQFGAAEVVTATHSNSTRPSVTR